MFPLPPLLAQLGEAASGQSEVFGLRLKNKIISFAALDWQITDLSCEGAVHELEEISEEVAVGVLTELVEDKPVPEVAVAQHVLAGGHIWGGEASDLDDDEEPSDGRDEDGDQSEEEVGGGQQGQSEHPEPEQQVNLPCDNYSVISLR